MSTLPTTSANGSGHVKTILVDSPAPNLWIVVADEAKALPAVSNMTAMNCISESAHYLVAHIERIGRRPHVFPCEIPCVFEERARDHAIASRDPALQDRRDAAGHDVCGALSLCHEHVVGIIEPEAVVRRSHAGRIVGVLDVCNGTIGAVACLAGQADTE